MIVNDLVNIVKENPSALKIKALLPDGTTVDVGQQYYIEDDVYFLFKADDDIQTLAGLKCNLENEAADECWSDGLFDDGYPCFTDCNIMMLDCTANEFYGDGLNYYINKIIVDNDVVLLCCSEDEACEPVENSKPNEVTTLSSIEKDMIRHALNHYGDYFAERLGYSSGEPYWDLMKKIK